MDEDLKNEDKFAFKVEKITGAHGEDTGCGVFRRRLVFGDGTAGTLVSCILVSAEKENLGVYLGDIFELCVKRLEDSKENILDSLDLAREARFEYARGKNLKASFIDCFFYDEACYVLRFGDEIRLFGVNGQDVGEIKVELGSGPVLDGQTFLIATRKFLDIFDTNALIKTEKIDLEEIIDGLGATISAISDQAEIGAVFVMAKKEGGEGLKSDVVRDGIEGEKNDEEIKGDLNSGIRGDEPETEIDSNIRTVFGDAPQDKPQSRLKIVNPLPGFFSGLIREVLKLRHGDIKAIFRLRRNIVGLSVIVVLILIGSVSYNLYSQRLKTRQTQVSTYLAGATSKYNEALAISTINRERARTLLVDADNELKSALLVDPKNTDVNNLKNEIATKLKETESAVSVSFQTVGEFGDDVAGLAFSGKNLAVVHGNALAVINLSDKKKTEMNIGEVTKAVAVYSGSAFVLTADKVKKVDLASGKVKEIGNESGTDIDVFFGNVYILGKNQIRKLVPIENGYSGSDYLGSKMDFAPSSRISIDSSVWVTKGDKILKFTRGTSEKFDISGLVNANFTLGAIYTNADSDNLYVVDSANSVLLVIDKKGVFKKVYQGAEFANVHDLAVDETAGKMYIAVGSKILVASL